MASTGRQAAAAAPLRGVAMAVAMAMAMHAAHADPTSVVGARATPALPRPAYLQLCDGALQRGSAALTPWHSMQSERVSGLASSVLSEESGLAVTRLLGWDRPSATTKYTAVATATTTATADAAADANKDDYHRVAATDVAAGASQPRLCSAPNECPTRLRAFNGGAAPGSKPESERHRPLDGSAAAASMPESERDRPPDGASPPASASELRSPNGQCVARLEPWRFAVHGPGGVVSVVFQVAPDKTEPQLSGVQLQVRRSGWRVQTRGRAMGQFYSCTTCSSRRGVVGVFE
eukprot:360178-Chlamydomonas_euryale.AAC.2